MRILISPFSSRLRNGNNNAKNYPLEWWKEIIKQLSDNHEVIQVGLVGEEKIADKILFNLRMETLSAEILKSDLFISVDNFFPHMVSHYPIKGIVLWGRSDPNLFGYPIFTNLVKDSSNLRPNQFDTWEGVAYSKDIFVSPDRVIEEVKALI